jgi:hypothetical protein
MYSSNCYLSMVISSVSRTTESLESPDASFGTKTAPEGASIRKQNAARLFGAGLFRADGF